MFSSLSVQEWRLATMPPRTMFFGTHSIALIQQNEDFNAIQAGVADMNAGRVRPIREVDAEIRSRLGFSSQQ